MAPGPKQVQVSCGQKISAPFTVVFVNLELEANSAPLAPGEHRTLTVHVRGSTAKINLEARNLAEDVAELQGGAMVRAMSTSGAENVAKFELVGKKRGSFVISIRLLAPLGAPRTN
jgi:phage FluMu protein gp41